MAAYSMDLRQRVARAWDADPDAEAIAAKYEVSRAWVHRLIQRRRETGSLAPRKQTKFRRCALTAAEYERLHQLITAEPDATLMELRAALPTTAALSTLWRAIDRLGLTVKKNRTRRRTSAP
jgi:transposase